MCDIEKYCSRDYTIRIQGNDRHGYFCEVLELPGCWAQGATILKALDILDEAKHLWIKTQLEDKQKIPMPFTQKRKNQKPIFHD